ncbi:hypothetical protein DVH24_013128 [Malus domestica]|uniref:RING-type domain-containing protein n=1 Tax=Malus domestica TaxID=3750 RepID=A0A498IRI4_MALDO|nr:hypothetical protein DVH24_013128 [Malus domestica]
MDGHDQLLIDVLTDLSTLQHHHQAELGREEENVEKKCGNHGGVCAICLDEIVLQETALVKVLGEFSFRLTPGTTRSTFVEHKIITSPSPSSSSLFPSEGIFAPSPFCPVPFRSVPATCILRWVTYSQKPTCPQCKHPFEFLNVHRSLDGSIQDYMFEESVCLLLRAKWFEPLVVEEREEVYEGHEDYYYYPYEDEEDDDLDDAYFSSSSVIRIGNRRWGDNGYVRGGRQEARPVHRSSTQDSGASSSREPRKKEAAVDKTGRRAKRALKREAADKAAAAKHQQHLARLGRK